MNFNSFKYAIFLPIVFALFWISPAKWRTKILLVASYVFYMSWRPIYLLLILGLTVCNYWFGHRIWGSTTNKKKWMIAAVALNLLSLAYFKYFYFLEDSTLFLLKPWFPSLDRLAVNIVLPLGISFFVFEFIHYVVDVYRGSKPVDNFVSFALFPSFFPTQIAGPIKRFRDFIPQLSEHHAFSWAEFDEGVFLILTGLAKKVLLADNLALFVSGGFSNPLLFSSADMWLFSLGFSFQIWLDFSGYADIARGSAKLFGYKVPINFNFPYLSASVSEFWRRWHITLGSWLRDYVYIPLGGSRGGRVNTARNLIITMALGGLWHGAEWHFIIWGFYHGILLALHKEFSEVRASIPRVFGWLDTKAGNVFSIFLTFLVSVIGFAIFRADNAQVVGIIMRKLLFIDALTGTAAPALASLSQINYPLIYPSTYLVLPAILVGQILVNRLQNSSIPGRFPRAIKIAYGTALIFLLVSFAPDNSPRFIYYQF